MARTDSKPLAGKVVLVTGGAKRLGRAAALVLAESGADVAITFLHSSREAKRTLSAVQERGVRGLALRCDVTNPTSVRETVAAAKGQLGSIDILVNNAGKYETVAFDDLTVEQWDNIFATNVRGPFLVSKAALPQLRQRKGRIINLGSLGGIRPWSSHAHYCCSKAALHMLTKVMAKALAPDVAVNCVAPGMIDVEGNSDSAFMQKMAKQTPMRRNGSVTDVSAAILFFAAAPHFITGQILSVDGGLGL